MLNAPMNGLGVDEGVMCQWSVSRKAPDLTHTFRVYDHWQNKIIHVTFREALCSVIAKCINNSARCGYDAVPKALKRRVS